MFYDVSKADDTTYIVQEPGQHIFFVCNKSCDLKITLAVPGADVFIFGLYFGRGSEQYTLHTTQQHSVGHNTSNLFIKGVFDDQSKFKYEGLIRIEKGADGSHAYQKNQNLILSPGTFVDSRPYLEILANDVFCTHGSTTGRVNAEQVEYARSRGIPAPAARQMLVEGFVEDLFQKMIRVDRSLENQIVSYQSKYLSA